MYPNPAQRTKNVQEILPQLGLEDMRVVAKRGIRESYSGPITRTVVLGEFYLSELCGGCQVEKFAPLEIKKKQELVPVFKDKPQGMVNRLMRWGVVTLIKKLGKEEILHKTVEKADEWSSLNIIIEKDGEDIGFIDSDGGFHYEAAPDLQTCMGWAAATDFGMMEGFLSYNLAGEREKLLQVINNAPFEGEEEEVKEYFFNEFFDQVKKAVEGATRFGDGYCGVALNYWRVGTRELGKEHEGFNYMY